MDNLSARLQRLLINQLRRNERTKRILARLEAL